MIIGQKITCVSLSMIPEHWDSQQNHNTTVCEVLPQLWQILETSSFHSINNSINNLGWI